MVKFLKKFGAVFSKFTNISDLKNLLYPIYYLDSHNLVFGGVMQHKNWEFFVENIFCTF